MRFLFLILVSHDIHTIIKYCPKIITNQKNNIKEITAFCYFVIITVVPPHTGSKECKHYVLFDFKHINTLFQTNIDPHLHNYLLES